MADLQILKDAHDTATAKLLIAIAFLIPIGTDIQAAIGNELLVYRDSVRNLAIAEERLRRA